MYFHHRFSTNQTATKSLGTPNPSAFPPLATAAPSHLQVPEGAEISSRGSRDTRSRDPAGERSSPSTEPGDASGPSPEADHAGFNFTEPRSGAARRASRAPLPHQPGHRQRAPLPPLLSYLLLATYLAVRWGWGSIRREKKIKPTHQCKADIFMLFLILSGIQRSRLTGWPGIWASVPGFGSECALGWAAPSSSGAGSLPSAQLQHPATERGREARIERRGRRLGWAGREQSSSQRMRPGDRRSPSPRAAGGEASSPPAGARMRESPSRPFPACPPGDRAQSVGVSVPRRLWRRQWGRFCVGGRVQGLLGEDTLCGKKLPPQPPVHFYPQPRECSPGPWDHACKSFRLSGSLSRGLTSTLLPGGFKRMQS